MAIDKDPSVYRDRGMIGSSDELDEYGVWVKSEPEDIGSAPASPIEEPTLPDIEDLPDLELDSTEPFDFPPAEAGLPEEGNEAAEEAPESAAAKTDRAKMDFSVADGGEVGGESLPSFEDIASFEAELPPVSNEDFTELSMDDFLEGDEETVSGQSDLGAEEGALDIDLDFKDSGVSQQSQAVEADFDFQVEDEGTPPASGSDSSFALETVSDFDDFLNDLSDTEKAAEPAAEAAVSTQAEETIEEQPAAGAAETEDIAFDVEESEPVATTFEAVEESEEIVLSEMEADTEKAETAAPEESFDDVAALSRDLAEEESREAPAADAGLSTQLLMRIADELSSIKTELSSLKEELAVLRGEAKPAQAEEKAPPASHGFFDEEDDEKIALTGDELDNILNTADFTEEAGADATAELSDEAIIDDFLMDREDLLGTTEEAAPAAAEAAPAGISAEEEIAEEPAIQDISFEEESEAAIERITLDEPAPEAVPEELQQLQVSGVSPMTPPPEDTSYLEADDLATADIDLSEAVIDEPDLGGPILEETPVVEPSIEHIDLDMEESLHIEGDEAEPQGEGFENIELTLDEFIGEDQGIGQEMEIALEESAPVGPAEEAPAIEESFAEVVPEGFVVEPEGSAEAEAEAEAEPAEAFETVELTEESEESQPLPVDIRQEVKAVLSYMDQLLESLPEDKIEEFAKSEYFDTYKKLFEELGLV